MSDDAGWHPISTAPFGEWLRIRRDGEIGTNICFRRRMPGDVGVEWIDRDGRTTVTHSTFAAPTHWRPLKAS